MADDWFKLNMDIFSNRKIKYLRRLPDGNSIALFWIALLSEARRCNSDGKIFLTESIPYTPDMLAEEFNFEENTVKAALDVFHQLDMIFTSNGFITVAGWEDHQNIEGLTRIRESKRLSQARWRAKQKALAEAPTVDSTVDSTEIEGGNAEEDIEKEIDLERDKKKSASQPSKADVEAFFESIWELYPVKKGKAQVSETKRKALYKIGFDAMERAINRYLTELKKDASWRKPQNGSTFFNSGYVDYLDDNFVPDAIKQQQTAKQGFYQKQTKADELDEFYAMAAQFGEGG